MVILTAEPKWVLLYSCHCDSSRTALDVKQTENLQIEYKWTALFSLDANHFMVLWVWTAFKHNMHTLQLWSLESMTPTNGRRSATQRRSKLAACNQKYFSFGGHFKKSRVEWLFWSGGWCLQITLPQCDTSTGVTAADQQSQTVGWKQSLVPPGWFSVRKLGQFSAPWLNTETGSLFFDSCS